MHTVGLMLVSLLPPYGQEIANEALLAGGIGYGAGVAVGSNPELFGSTLAVFTLANVFFYELANACVRPLLNCLQTYADVTPELTYAVTCVSVSTLTFIALNQLELISRRVAGVFVIISLAAFAGRLRIIYGG